jgi:hypothetical protein
MREKPVFPAHSGASLGGGPNAGMAGWRRSADRTFLRANSLQTGNLTEKTQGSGGSGDDSRAEHCCGAALSEQFPMIFNREIISWISEMFDRNSEFYGQNSKCRE